MRALKKWPNGKVETEKEKADQEPTAKSYRADALTD